MCVVRKRIANVASIVITQSCVAVATEIIAERSCILAKKRTAINAVLRFMLSF